MVKMTPEQEAAYALNFGVARGDLPKNAQLAYDRLVEERSRVRTPALVFQADRTTVSDLVPAADEAVKTWRARARSRWRITALLGATTVLLFLVLLILAPVAVEPAGRSCRQCPPIPQPSQVWVILSALGTLAAGLGTLVSGIAAVLALRAATAARNAATASAEKSSAKHARKR
jgi:hypothetical protein